jgi:hypothetical protein
VKTKNTPFIIIFIIIAGVTFSQHPVFRWDVKTLTDSSGVDRRDELEKVKSKHFASIEGLTKKPVQFNSCYEVGNNTRRFDGKRVVKLKVCLIRVKKETNDK